MNIMFICHHFYPHIGGVEKHVFEVSKSLIKKGNKITVVTEKYNSNLMSTEIVDGINVIRFSYGHIKYIGLFSIWRWMVKNRKMFEKADVIHCHDVFIWYLPLYIILRNKIIVTTFHGWETVYPIPSKFIFLKKITDKLSTKTIVVGNYLNKYYGINSDKVIYGSFGLNKSNIKSSKKNGHYVFVGRLDKDTGLVEFLNNLDNLSLLYKKLDFCGDGPLRKECEKYGKVHGFTDPTPYYKKAEYVVPGGYLAALEALNYGCKIKLFWNNKLKEDYWKMSPFYKLKGKKLYNWAREQTWDKLANEYLDLYNSSK